MLKKRRTRPKTSGSGSKENTDTLVRYNISRRFRLEDVMVENSTYARCALKRQIIREGVIPYECEECKLTNEWQGKSLSLHLDHRNGVNNDHRLKNLRFLCPNCHSQQETYAGKNIGRKK